jgi:hypothetical protein
MMKLCLLALAAFTVISCNAAPSTYEFSLPATTQLSLVAETPTPPANDLCDTCIQFAGSALNELINLILNKAVLGSCGKLCGALANATNSQPLGEVCNVLCDVVGLKAFINWISHADLSPIWNCEQLGVCKANDNGDAKITSFLVTPASGPQGTEFTISFVYSSTNGTGTGELRIGLTTVDHQAISFNSVYIPYSTTGGNFKGSGTVTATPAAPGCDPTQSTCEEWLPGVYPVNLKVCEGECGDTKHPHAKLYDSKNTSFTITSGPGPRPGPTPPGPAPPPPSPGSPEYEDPNAGPCSTGEMAVQITGLQGSFCSPSCSASSPCPTNVPNGATAKPTCALNKPGGSSPTQCALICNPAEAANQCPDKASCKKIQTVGICTYDS